MNKIIKYCFLATSSLLLVSACGGGTSSSEEPDNRVNVFVLSGQSNMEGSTYYVHPRSGEELLKNYMDEAGLDYARVEAGLNSVQTSFYGYYYPNGWNSAHSSSLDKSTPEARLQPNFAPTTVGMGVGDNVNGKTEIFMGPELGLANTIADSVDEENPVYLVKCAFSGSGFHKTDGATWLSREEDPSKSLYYLLKRYTKGCLEEIENQGKQPVIRGLVWHQGESDTSNNAYAEEMKALINDFKTDFADYLLDEDPDNFAFLDCTIYDGSKRTYGENPGVNAQKLSIANESEDDLYFCVDGSFKTENGLKLEIGDDAKGGYNTYHYNTPDCYRLGEAFGNIILDNGLLDF